MWNFHPERDEEPLKVFEKEGRKDRSHGGLSAALREVSGSKKTPTESLEPGVMSAVGCQEWERRGGTRDTLWNEQVSDYIRETGQEGGQMLRTQNSVLDLGPVQAEDVETEGAQ